MCNLIKGESELLVDFEPADLISDTESSIYKSLDNIFPLFWTLTFSLITKSYFLGPYRQL